MKKIILCFFLFLVAPSAESANELSRMGAPQNSNRL